VSGRIAFSQQIKTFMLSASCFGLIVVIVPEFISFSGIIERCQQFSWF
jgi:hypothetical protein